MKITRWTSDSCDCVLDFDENGNLDDWFQKCSEHDSLDGQPLFVAVVNHNKSIAQGLPKIHTKAEANANHILKQNEKTRIRGNGQANRNPNPKNKGRGKP